MQFEDGVWEAGTGEDWDAEALCDGLSVSFLVVICQFALLQSLANAKKAQLELNKQV